MKWLSIKDRLKLNDASVVFKCINNLAPGYLANKSRSHVHDRQTRSPNPLDVPFAAYQLINTFSSTARAKLWNTILKKIALDNCQSVNLNTILKSLNVIF